MTHFTLEYYKLLLNKLKKHYSFINFNNYLEYISKTGPLLLLRHDIDISIEKALEIAKIENKLGITSNYFVLLRSPFFNPLSEDYVIMLNTIIDLGHTLDLHFHAESYDNINLNNVEKYVLTEIKILESVLTKKVESISFHHPNLDFAKKVKINGIVNTYGEEINRHFQYLSDSRGKWRFGSPLEHVFVKKRKNLQLLIHPIWFNENNQTPVETLRKSMNFSTKCYNENLIKHYTPWKENLKK